MQQTPIQTPIQNSAHPIDPAVSERGVHECAVPELSANGHHFPDDPALVGHLESATEFLEDGEALRQLMASRGYLFFRRLLSPELVLSARREILQKYAIIGEIADEDEDGNDILMDALAPGLELSEAPEDGALTKVNVRAFSASVRSGHFYRSVVEAEAVMAVHECLVDGPVHCYDFRWPRFVRPQEGCGFHCDGPYMNRGTAKLNSSWIPLGRIAPENGALIILEDSHLSEELHAGYLSKDADDDGLVWLDSDPVEVAKKYGKRWLTTTFEPGDVLCFSMHTLHGALDNNDPDGRCRLSSDSRYQLATEQKDPRWNGADPAVGGSVEGHGGSRVFYPGLGAWQNADFQDEWKYVDRLGRLKLRADDSRQ